jgi:putative peptidoglycan lipid II flippase
MSTVDNSVAPPAPDAKRRSIARSAGIVSIAVMGSRLFGLVREMVFGTFFGASFANDAFIIAFRVPNLLRDLFAEGALSAAFVTTFSQTLARRGEREAWRLANLVNNGLALVLSLVVVGGIIFAPQVVNMLIEPSHVPSDPVKAALTVSLAIKMTRIMFPFLIMISLAAVAMGVLNTKDRFGIPASASTLFNVGSIVGGLASAYLLAPDYISAIIHNQATTTDGAARAIVGMAIGTLFGGMLQWLVQVPSLRAVGYRWQPVLSFRDEGVRQVMRLMAPAIIGVAAVQINVFVNTKFASSLGVGPVSWLQYAFRLMQFPIGVFGVAISTATLPVASRAAALEKLDEFRKTIASSLRLTFLMTIPSAVGLIVLSRPIIALIYQHRQFKAYDTAQAAAALECYALGLTAYSSIRVLAPGFYALKDTRIPMAASALSIIINYIVATATVRYLNLGHRGLALSISAVAIVNFTVLLVFMRRKLGGIEGGSLLATAVKVSIASTLMGLVCWLASRQLESLPRLLLVSVSIAIGIAVFYVGARLLRIEELDQIVVKLKRKFGRRNS